MDCRVLDGALATELERHGADIGDALWSARLMRDDPAAIARVHRDYLDAGADVIITASYQATVDGLVRAGSTPEQARALIVSAVTLARQVRDEFATATGGPAVAGAGGAIGAAGGRPAGAASVGPCGAALADGSEYRGDYGVDEAGLRDFHADRMRLLVDAGPDVLACETIPSVVEARALAGLVAEVAHPARVPAWMTFTARDDSRIADGTPIAEVARITADHGIAAVGVNCVPLELVAPLVSEIRRVTEIPVVVYPNSGEVWDARTRTWTGTSARGGWATWVARWRDAGATTIGGCCRTTPADVAEIADAVHAA